MSEELYSLPLYYDIAFTWDLSPELDFFERLYERHVPFDVQRILEPACGTGRFLRVFPTRGYVITGYDRSPDMLAFACERIAEAGLGEMAEAVRGEMTGARYDREFDMALNSINSLGYLLTDEEIVSHFRLTGEALRRGGIYVVHIACALDCEPDPAGDTWTMERDGISVTTTWGVVREDRDTRLSHQLCRMEICDHGRAVTLVEPHVLRLWFYEEFRDLVARSGTLELKAIYSEKFDEIPLDSHITGEMGNLYYVLKAIQHSDDRLSEDSAPGRQQTRTDGDWGGRT
jgi:SAM-dependent methyltransferase